MIENQSNTKTLKIAITGGYGNLGTWITKYLADAGHNVTVVANSFKKSLAQTIHAIELCDVTDLDACKKAFGENRFDVIIHLASNSTGSFKDALDVHTLGTRNILEVIQEADIQPAHFIYFSTFQVYGTYEGTIDEDVPLNPRNDYGNTHLFAEYYIRQFARNVGLKYTSLRLTNSYGCPKDINTTQWSLILNDLARMAFEKQEIVLKSNGKAPRDFIWMGDVCKAVENLIQNGPLNDVFNLSGEHTFEMKDIAFAVQKAYESKYGKKLEVRLNPNDTSEFPNPLHVSSQKLRQIIDIPSGDHFEDEALKIFELLERHSAKVSN